MSRRVYFITHPNVVISEDIPVPRWPLFDTGRKRMHAGLRQEWTEGITSLYCSTQQKAIDAAEILGEHPKLPAASIENLGENHSVRGWERAVASV